MSAPCSAQRRPAPPSALRRADPTRTLCVRVLESTGDEVVEDLGESEDELDESEEDLGESEEDLDVLPEEYG